ncbi:MAG: hypothetical protein ACI85V_001122 [bacterium]|jgi:hypothetical protein
MADDTVRKSGMQIQMRRMQRARARIKLAVETGVA